MPRLSRQKLPPHPLQPHPQQKGAGPNPQQIHEQILHPSPTQPAQLTKLTQLDPPVGIRQDVISQQAHLVIAPRDLRVCGLGTARAIPVGQLEETVEQFALQRIPRCIATKRIRIVTKRLFHRAEQVANRKASVFHREKGATSPPQRFRKFRIPAVHGMQKDRRWNRQGAMAVTLWSLAIKSFSGGENAETPITMRRSEVEGMPIPGTGRHVNQSVAILRHRASEPNRRAHFRHVQARFRQWDPRQHALPPVTAQEPRLQLAPPDRRSQPVRVRDAHLICGKTRLDHTRTYFSRWTAAIRFCTFRIGIFMEFGCLDS